MRVPSSHNSKDGAWIEVTTVTEHDDTYTLAQLEQWLATATPVLRRLAPEKGNGHDHDDPWAALAEAQEFKLPIDVDQRLAEMRHHGPGENAIHPTQLSVTAALLGRGTPIDEVVARVLAATRVAAGPTGNGWDWRREESDIRMMCDSWLAKHPEIEKDTGKPIEKGVLPNIIPRSSTFEPILIAASLIPLVGMILVLILVRPRQPLINARN